MRIIPYTFLLLQEIPVHSFPFLKEALYSLINFTCKSLPENCLQGNIPPLPFILFSSISPNQNNFHVTVSIIYFIVWVHSRWGETTEL